MDSMGAKRREERLQQVFSPDEMISRETYNLILCGVLVYGLLVNVILCAVVGDVTKYMNPIAFLILYFVCAFVGILLSAKSSNPIVSFVGYNLIVVPLGLLISTAVEAYSTAFGSQIIVQAFLITMCITASMMVVAVMKPEWCERFGPLLLPCLIGMVVAELICLLLKFDHSIYAWLGAILFSLYIAYDIYRSQQFACTVDNAVDCAVDIYLDIANLFLRILEILGRSKSRK